MVPHDSALAVHLLLLLVLHTCRLVGSWVGIIPVQEELVNL